MGRFAFDAWDAEQGLPQATVTDLVQDDRGLLYATTFGGATRFDGVRFVPLDTTEGPLTTIRFTAVAVHGDTLWLGTQDGQVASLTGERIELLPDTGMLEVRALFHDGERLWAGVGDQLLRLDGDHWVAHPRHTNQIVADDRVLWIAGDSGLATIDRAHPESLVPVAVPFTGPVSSVHVDRRGAVWIAGEQGVAVRPAGEAAFLPIGLDAREPYAAVLTLDRDGRVWLGHTLGLELLGDGDALIAAARAGAPVQRQASWAVHGVRSLLVDREGNLWAGTDTEGLVRILPLSFERVPSPSPDQPAVRVVERDGDRMLVAPICRGVYALAPDGTASEVLPADRCVHALRATERGVLVGDAHELLWLSDPDHPLAELERDIIAIEVAPDGTVLVGTDGDGAWTLRGEQLTRVDAVPATASVHTLVADPTSDDTWWAGLGDSLVVFGPRGSVRFGPEQGMPIGQVRAVLFEPGHSAWVGTYGGGLVHLGALDRLWDAASEVTLHRLSERDGLPDNTVSALADDGRGGLWGHGNRGLFAVSADALTARVRGEPVPIGRRLQSPEANGGAAPAVAEGPDGALWFPTIDGIVRMRPEAQPLNRVAPQPVIEEVSVDGHAWPIDGGWSAPPGRRDTVVRFTAAVLGHPQLARFRYRLMPIQQEWHDTEQRVVRFASLPPGSYEFQVQAANEDGLWSLAPGTLAFSLERRLDEEPLVRLLAALAVLVALLSLVQIQRHRNKALQHEIEVRLRTEAALRDQEAHYRLVFDAASDGLLVVDDQGAVREANPSAVAMFGPRVVGQQAAALLAEDTGGARGLRPDGSSFPARVSRARLDEGRELWSIGDLTLQVQLQEGLAKADRLEAVGRLAGSVAHEFNNLLAVARANAGAVRAALADRPDESGLVESVQLIERASARGAHLVTQLLAYGQRQLLRPVPTDLREVVARAQPLAERVLPPGTALVVRGDGPVVVLVDPGQAELALVNLVLVAAGGEGGPPARRIEVTVARCGPADQAWLGHLGRECGVVSVTSDRPPDGDPSRLFEPFAGTPGVGLGLAAVGGFVSQSGGLARADAVDHRTVYRIALPSIEDEPTPQPAAPSPPPPAREARILVVDDDPIVRRTLERLLKAHGYTVWSASGGEEALAKLGEVPVDLLLTDVLMPGMSGPDLVDAARTDRPTLRVLFVSGYTQQVHLEAFTDPLVEKPFDTASLLSAVQKVLA
ncbi:MAG: response regulator [Myxococcota bacterium]